MSCHLNSLSAPPIVDLLGFWEPKGKWHSQTFLGWTCPTGAILSLPQGGGNMLHYAWEWPGTDWTQADRGQVPTSLPIPSLWVIPVHHPQASCILLQTWTGNSFLIWYYTYFNAILPNHPPTPSPTESKRLFYTSASLLLSRIQGYHYHLSKFHIYGLVCCIDVFLSGLLHCIIGSSFIHLIRTDSNVFFLMSE